MIWKIPRLLNNFYSFYLINAFSAPIQTVSGVLSDGSNYLYSIYVCNNQVTLKKQKSFQRATVSKNENCHQGIPVCCLCPSLVPIMLQCALFWRQVAIAYSLLLLLLESNENMPLNTESILQLFRGYRPQCLCSMLWFEYVSSEGSQALRAWSPGWHYWEGVGRLRSCRPAGRCF